MIFCENVVKSYVEVCCGNGDDIMTDVGFLTLFGGLVLFVVIAVAVVVAASVAGTSAAIADEEDGE